MASREPKLRIVPGSDEECEQAAARRLRSVRMIGPLRRLIKQIHLAGTERDRAGNRQFFYDHYLSLLLLYFVNPSLTSLRSLQNASNWEKVRKRLGIPRVSLGSLSESARVFDPALVRPILKELVELARPHFRGREAEALANLTAVDGTVFSALPRMAWALWMDAEHRGVKVHLQFHACKGVPGDVVISPAASSEPAALASMLEAGRLYVCDRGYASFELFRSILDAQSSLIVRVKDDIALQVQEERPISAAAAQAGVVRDVILKRLGTSHHKDVVGRPMRLVVVKVAERDGKTTELCLVTDRFDLDADLVAVAYRYRWSIELFFCWLKCVLGAKHLVSHNQHGVALQMYAALLVSLLIAIRTGSKPNQRTFETIQFFLLGWVSDAEFAAHLAQLAKARLPKPTR
jgi:Transposase DDE domain